MWLGAAAIVATGQSRYEPVVKVVKPAPLAKARTYTWTQRHPAFNADVNRQIVAAVDRELGSRGFTKVTSGSDVLVTYASLTRTDIDLKSKKTPSGGAPEYAVGTLVVELSDAATTQALFRVQIDTPIERDPAALQTAIDTAVKAMFEKYPAPSKR